MEITTVKVRKKTKSELDTLRGKQETYDALIHRLILEIKKQGQKKELIEVYKSMGKEELDILNEWDHASYEVD